MKKQIIGAIITIVVIALCICAIAIPATGNDNPPSTTISEDYIPSETTSSIEETSVPDATETQSVEEPTVEETILPTEPVIVTKPIEPKPEVKPTEPTAPKETEPEVTETEPEVDETESSTEEVDPWAKRAAEYPVATEIWLYMKNLGWSDEVCAGVMGNIMAECGGQTLEIQWWLYGGNRGFYGICQWHKGYFPAVQGQDLQFQLDYLRDTIEDQFDDFGSNALSNFLSTTNSREAALIFAKRYERCSSASYSVRQRNAEKAYAYFLD